VYNYQNHIVYLNSAKMSVSLSAVTQWQSRIIEPILVACWWWSGRSFSSCSLGVAVLDQLVDPKACLDGGLVKISWLELLPESCLGVVWLETWEICLVRSACVAACTPGRQNRSPGSSRELPGNNHSPNPHFLSPPQLLYPITLLPLPLSSPPHSVDFLSSLCSLESRDLASPGGGKLLQREATKSWSMKKTGMFI
jgi:hypothetical protein